MTLITDAEVRSGLPTTLNEKRNAQMNKQQTKVRELQALPETKSTNQSWHRLYAALTDPDLQVVAAFCLIGLLLTLNLIFRFPDMGAVIAQYNQF
ncbi:MAG: hypothetical protein WBD90_13055 [Xanthobacteraceae bacterium]